MTEFSDGKADLDAVLAEAVQALSVLDAGVIEALAEFLEGNPERVRLPGCSGDWERPRSRRWVLGHLLDGTWQRLEMLRRVASPAEDFGSYGVWVARKGSLPPNSCGSGRFALPPSRSAGVEGR